MLNTTPTTLRSAKLPPDVMPASDRYPHYRLVPLAGSDGRYCLFFHIHAQTLVSVGSQCNAPPHGGAAGQNAGKRTV